MKPYSPHADQTVLLAEDDPNDVLLMQRAFRKNEALDELHVVENGAQAIAYLSGAGKFADRQQFPFPNLVITDLKMPVVDGLQLLQWMQSVPACRCIRSVLLSSSDFPSDWTVASSAGVCCCYTKPVLPDDLVEMITRILSAGDSPKTQVRHQHSTDQNEIPK